MCAKKRAAPQETTAQETTAQRVHIGGEFFREGPQVVWSNGYTSKILSGANPDTFRALNKAYGTDGLRVFCRLLQVRSADPKTFVALSECFAKDKLRVFCKSTIVKEAKVDSFRVICAPGDPLGRGVDDSAVFSAGDSKVVRIKAADPQTFAARADGYYADAKSIFWGSAKIPGADLATWRPLRSDYSCDAKQAFYLNRPIRGADVETFRPLPSGFGRWARDKRRFYEQAAPAKAKQYVAEFERHAAVLGTVQKITVQDDDDKVVTGADIPLRGEHMWISVRVDKVLRVPKGMPGIRAGTSIEVFNRFLIGECPIEIAAWQKRAWIWFLWHGNGRFIPANSWLEFSPPEELASMQALLAELF